MVGLCGGLRVVVLHSGVVLCVWWVTPAVERLYVGSRWWVFYYAIRVRLCGWGGYGYAVVWDYAGVAGLCVSRCGVMVSLCGGYGIMVGRMGLCGRYGYAVVTQA